METLQDLLTIDTDKNKADDNKKLLRKVKQLLKAETKEEAKKEVLAENLPYEGVSVVGNKLVTLKFDLDSKEAFFEKVEVDPRDVKFKNHMAAYNAGNIIKDLSKNQREK